MLIIHWDYRLGRVQCVIGKFCHCTDTRRCNTYNQEPGAYFYERQPFPRPQRKYVPQLHGPFAPADTSLPASEKHCRGRRSAQHEHERNDHWI